MFKFTSGWVDCTRIYCIPMLVTKFSLFQRREKTCYIYGTQRLVQAERHNVKWMETSSDAQKSRYVEKSHTV